MPSKTEFDLLIHHYSERVYNHAYRMLGNREDAEEATHDVFLRIRNGLGEFRGEAQLYTWIWRITTNVCLTRRAKRKPQTVALDSWEGEDPYPDVDLKSNPEALLIEQEEREMLARCLAELPEREAAAISLFYLDDMSYEEIARTLEMPSGSVATALHRGRERLRRLMSRRKE